MTGYCRPVWLPLPLPVHPCPPEQARPLPAPVEGQPIGFVSTKMPGEVDGPSYGSVPSLPIIIFLIALVLMWTSWALKPPAPSKPPGPPPGKKVKIEVDC